jgi:hypothetical protein
VHAHIHTLSPRIAPRTPDRGSPISEQGLSNPVSNAHVSILLRFDSSTTSNGWIGSRTRIRHATHTHTHTLTHMHTTGSKLIYQRLCHWSVCLAGCASLCLVGLLFDCCGNLSGLLSDCCSDLSRSSFRIAQDPRLLCGLTHTRFCAREVNPPKSTFTRRTIASPFTETYCVGDWNSNATPATLEAQAGVQP